MANTIRTPTELLIALLRDVTNAQYGPALLDALGSGMAARQSLIQHTAVPWTLKDAIQALESAPHGATLFGAIRLLQGAQPTKESPGYSVRSEDDGVRLDQTLLLGFAPGDVDLVKADSGRPILRQSAFGLLGPNGALPYRWTEHAHDLAQGASIGERDLSFLAWLNVVQRRQTALFYRAWSDAQAVAAADRTDRRHPIADRLRALAGVSLPGLQQRDSIDDAFKMAFAAVLSRRVRNPVPLASMVALYFGAGVRIEEFAPHWLDIPPDQRSRLGMAFATLGEDAVVGTRLWDLCTRFRILVGPLSLERYHRFLPGRDDYEHLGDIVSLYVGVEFEWVLVPILHRDSVPISWLGNTGLLLGWSSWLGVRSKDAEEIDAQDLMLAMSPRLNSADSQQWVEL